MKTVTSIFLERNDFIVNSFCKLLDFLHPFNYLYLSILMFYIFSEVPSLLYIILYIIVFIFSIFIWFYLLMTKVDCIAIWNCKQNIYYIVDWNPWKYYSTRPIQILLNTTDNEEVMKKYSRMKSYFWRIECNSNIFE